MFAIFTHIVVVTFIALSAGPAQADESPVSPAPVPPSMTSKDAHLPEDLVGTGLYASFSEKIIDSKNRLYIPRFPLWTDGAEKHRWIYLPPNTKIDSSDPNRWVFPVGTKLWKEFKVNGRRMETRYLEKVSAEPKFESWSVAAYEWNEDESVAKLCSACVLPGKLTDAGGHFVDQPYDIPDSTECIACHKRGGDPVVGFDAVQLSQKPALPVAGAVSHAAPVPEDVVTAKIVTLSDLMSEGLLTTPVDVPDEVIGASANEVEAIGYIHGNCGHCHNSKGSARWTGLMLRTLIPDEARKVPAHYVRDNIVGRSGVGFLIPGQTETKMIAPGHTERSSIYYRMQHRDADTQMPPLGTKIPDQRALEAIAAWINELKP